MFSNQINQQINLGLLVVLLGQLWLNLLRNSWMHMKKILMNFFNRKRMLVKEGMTRNNYEIVWKMIDGSHFFVGERNKNKILKILTYQSIRKRLRLHLRQQVWKGFLCIEVIDPLLDKMIIKIKRTIIRHPL